MKAALWTPVVVATLALAGPALAARPLIGVVDVQRLQSEFQRAASLRNDLEAEEEKYQSELQEGQRRISDLEADQASEDVAAKAATADATVRARHELARDADEAKLEKTRSDFAERLRVRNQRRQELARQLNEELIDQAKTAVAKAAKRHGLDGVIDARVGLLGLPDLTDEVLDNLNRPSD